ncbi:MAG: DUF2235 domain-containing protein [Anderseniella sp.]|jgi:uncharacterized protein (DUF2235 family)|nr:DUF2235 domain-containing protein [Anderseniella sp.]
MKKIALFSDGTGNSASSTHKTNVWRAYQALDLSNPSRQMAYYDNGVGTSPFTPMALLGLAFGWGLARNVRQIYGFLCRSYEPGDEIYGFGFSRGAFTIRVAMALIASEGIIDRREARDDQDLDRLIHAAYRRFRHKHFTPSLLSFFLRPARDFLMGAWDFPARFLTGRVPYDPKKNFGYTKNATEDSFIRFLGVWDTVDAYGSPVDELTRAWDMVVWPLSAKDRDLSPRVARACHALALDEQRESFEPMLWNEAGMQTKSRLEDERLSQVWFPGVHANVGGGYPDDGMAFIALDWMIGQCEALVEFDQKTGKEAVLREGLRFIPEERERITAQAKINAPLYDNRSGIGNLYRYAPRHIERLCHEQKPGLANWLKEIFRLDRLYKLTEFAPTKKFMENRKLNEVNRNEVRIERPKIHHTVFDRLTTGASAYAPINLPERYAYVDSQGNVIDNSNAAAAPSALPESVEQAKERRQRQSYIWNRVWGRKLLYFSTLAAIIFVVTYPYWAEPTQEDSLANALMPFLGTFSVVVQQIPMLIGKIPGLSFAESWVAAYQPFPFAFLIGVVVIGLLLTASTYVARLLKAEMRLNWRFLTGESRNPTAGSGWLARLRSRFTKWLSNRLEGPTYATIEKCIRLTLEALAVLLLIVILFVVGARFFLIVADASGRICSADDTKAQTFGTPFDFDPTDACFNTGLVLKEGHTYQITLDVFDWKDKGIDTDVKGWCQEWCQSPPAWYLKLLTPLRRHLFADWYQPIARVDNRLLDRYPLALKDPDPRKEQTGLTTEITAHRTGDLYLYLNDAVLFSPSVLKEIYANNKGHAKVTVTEVSSK